MQTWTLGQALVNRDPRIARRDSHAIVIHNHVEWPVAADGFAGDGEFGMAFGVHHGDLAGVVEAQRTRRAVEGHPRIFEIEGGGI